MLVITEALRPSMAIFFSEPTQLDSALSSGYFTLSAADRGCIWHAKVYYDYVIDALSAGMQTDYNYML